jgi:hypothetical protein
MIISIWVMAKMAEIYSYGINAWSWESDFFAEQGSGYFL